MTDARAFNWDSIPIKSGVTANPAAGANPAAVTVPAGKKWQLNSVMANMVTAVAGANRYAYIDIQDDGASATRYTMAQSPITASLSVINCFLRGASIGGYVGADSILVTPMGDIELIAGAIFQLKYLNIQAADDCGVMRYTYKEVPA